MNLPKIYLVTGSNFTSYDDFIKELQKNIAKNIKLIQLRAKQLTDERYVMYAKSAIKLCKDNNVLLMLNTTTEIVKQLDTDGLHLTSDKLMRLSSNNLPDNIIISAACHNEEELLRAEELKLDFVTLSPVLPTKSHPKAIPLGWEEFSRLANKFSMPIYALGGMTAADIATSIANGGCGIAAISAFWDK